MKYLKIKNNGLIVPQALTLVGASTKRNDSTKIGQFGSGNKFALAYLLRNGHEIKVFSGLNEILIKTIPEEFRGETFNVVYVNNERTSITSEMGKDWELWQSIREIYCNSIDEGGHSMELVMNPSPIENETHFYISNNGNLNTFLSNFDNYFSQNKKVLFECEHGKILEKTGETANIYRKGVLCYKTKCNSVFDYDFNDIAIDENRIVKYFWDVERILWKIIFSCTNKDVIKKIMTNSCVPNMIEGQFSSISTIVASDVSDEFLEFFTDNRVAPSGYAGLLKPDERHKFAVIPTEIYNAVSEKIPDESKGDNFITTRTGASMKVCDSVSELSVSVLRKAMDFFEECKFDIPYKIIWAVFSKPTIMGCAVNEIIYISELSAEKGVNDLVSTIIEEYIHIKYGVEDETRGFQSAAINEIINVLKIKNAYVL